MRVWDDERIRAVGDVTGMGPLTHVAVHQAEIGVRDMIREDGVLAGFHVVPRATSAMRFPTRSGEWM